VSTKENFHRQENSGVDRRPVPDERVATREGMMRWKTLVQATKKSIISVELDARNTNRGSAH